MHDIELASARFYVGNLREEVIKGMREKAEQGIYPGRAPFGYRNNRETRTIEIHPDNSLIVKRIFELYASGNYSLKTLRAKVREEFGKTINHEYLRDILTNPVYLGNFEWAGKTYRGTHALFISFSLWEAAQSALHRGNKSKYRKHHFAFRGLLTCAHDDCTVTAEIQKKKYVYYRCSQGRGKCELPYFREEEISSRFEQVLKDIYIPEDVVAELENSLLHDEKQLEKEALLQQQRLEHSLSALRRRIDQAYSDKLDGKISEEFWQRKMAEWMAEERQIQAAIEHSAVPAEDRASSMQETFELANQAHLYTLRGNRPNRLKS